MTRGGDISDVTHRTQQEQHPGGQAGALCCWHGAAGRGHLKPVWVSGGCARLCHFPLVLCSHPDILGKSPAAGAGAAGDPLALPPPGWEPILTPWCWHCHHSKPGSISRCPNFPAVVPPPPEHSRDKAPALGAGSGSFPPRAKRPFRAGGNSCPGKAVDLQPSWHGPTLRPCGQCDPSSRCPLGCLTHNGSFISQS